MTHVTFSRDGRRLAKNSTGREGVVFVRDVKSGEEVAAITPGSDLQDQIRAGDFVLSDDGEKLLVGDRLFDLAGRAPPVLIHGLKWSRHHPRVEIGGSIPSLRSPFGGLVRHQPIPPPRVAPDGLVWTYDPRGVVTVRDPSAAHFRVPDEALDKRAGLVEAFTGATAVLGITAGTRRAVRSHWLLDLKGRRHELLLRYESKEEEVNEPALSADGNRAVFQTFPRPYSRESWGVHAAPDRPWGAHLTRPEGLGLLTMQITGGAAALPGAHALSLAGASRLRWLSPWIQPGEDAHSEVSVWDVPRRRWAFRRRFQRLGAHSTALSPKGDWLYLFEWPPPRLRPRVFHVDTGREAALARLPDRDRGTDQNAAFSPDGRRFAWAAEGGKEEPYRGKPTPRRLPTLLALWDLKSGRRVGVARFPAAQRECAVLALAFSPDGERLAGLLGTYATAGPGRPYEPRRCHLVVWKVGAGEALVVEREHDLGPWSPAPGDASRGRLLRFSPDGQYLAACVGLPESRSAVHVWAMATGARRHTFRVAGGPSHYRDFVAFTRDSRRVLTGGRLWDLSTGLELLTLTEALVGGRNESGRAHAYLLDGDVVRGVFAGKDEVRVYAYDGSR